MAPEHLEVSRDMLSLFALNLIDPRRPRVLSIKLIPNLMNKTKYVTHYKNLQLYTMHGLKVTKIHRVISFEQSPWLKPWIELCNQKRRDAASDFESDLAKLQENATFGKTMEQVWDRVNIRLIADPDTALKAVSSITFQQSEIVSPDLIMVRGARTRVELNKPIAVGFCILEISKLIMYRFYYKVLKAKYGENALCCSPTQTPSVARSELAICTRILGICWMSSTPATSMRVFPSIRRTTVGCWAISKAKRARWLRRNSSDFGQKCTVYMCPEIRGNRSKKPRASRNIT